RRGVRHRWSPEAHFPVVRVSSRAPQGETSDFRFPFVALFFRSAPWKSFSLHGRELRRLPNTPIQGAPGAETPSRSLQESLPEMNRVSDRQHHSFLESPPSVDDFKRKNLASVSDFARKNISALGDLASVLRDVAYDPGQRGIYIIRHAAIQPRGPLVTLAVS